MVSFSNLDIFIILLFFLTLVIVGFLPKKEKNGNSESFLLSNRNVGLLLFITTNVATWYGGILGVGEFTYRFGLLSWVTQGLPYYIFSILFAIFFAKKIRNASLFTIPDKLEQIYGKNVGMLSSILVFILVSPAPYLLMLGNLFMLMFNIPLIYGLILGILLSGVYLLHGGYNSDLYTDVFQFIIMFLGFIIVVFLSYNKYGGYLFFQKNLPPSHLQLTGNVSVVYIIVWFLIALWTFADPGFHQRCYAAKTGEIARKGIIISVFFFAAFDFLTTTTGLYSRAILPNIENPVLSFPLFAEKTLGSGVKGLFYAAMFATIMSTLNSFLFLSATTIGRDFFYKYLKETNNKKLIFYTRIGVIVSSVFAIIVALNIQSVLSIWYFIGSICIPPIIVLITGAYFPKLKVESRIAITEIIFSLGGSIGWSILKNKINNPLIQEIEPMIIGLILAVLIHLIGIKRKRLKTETAF